MAISTPIMIFLFHSNTLRFRVIVAAGSQHKQLFDNKSRCMSSCFDLGWKASDKAHYGKDLHKDDAICMA